MVGKSICPAYFRPAFFLACRIASSDPGNLENNHNGINGGYVLIRIMIYIVLGFLAYKFVWPKVAPMVGA